MSTSSRVFWVGGRAGLAAALLAGLMALAWAQGDASHAPLRPGLGQRLTEGYAASATARFAQATDTLQQRIDGLCTAAADGATDAPAAREAVRGAFQASVVAWSQIEFLRFGPLVEANRFERIQFWPDPRGVMVRQVQALLAQDGIQNLTPDALASQSVAVNGLPAIEFVLYRDGGLLDDGAGASPQWPASCAYARAASGALHQVAGEVAQAWQPQGAFGQLFSAPSVANPVYRSRQEIAAEAIKALATGLQFNGEVKLAPAIKDERWQDEHARRAPYWRSGLSLLAIRAAVQGMQQFYDAAGFVYEPEEAWRGEQLRKDLTDADRLLAALPHALQDQMAAAQVGAGADSAARLPLIQVRDLLHGARNRVSATIAPYVGVHMGFNALDGD